MDNGTVAKTQGAMVKESSELDRVLIENEELMAKLIMQTISLKERLADFSSVELTDKPTPNAAFGPRVGSSHIVQRMYGNQNILVEILRNLHEITDSLEI